MIGNIDAVMKCINCHYSKQQTEVYYRNYAALNFKKKFYKIYT